MAIKIKKERKNPRIVEYISPERKEVLDRVRKIARWSYDVTDDDIEFLKANGLDYDKERGHILKDGKYFDVPGTYTYGDKFDFLDAAEKHAERGTTPTNYRRGSSHDIDRDPEPVKRNPGQLNRTSDQLQKAARELQAAKRWGTDRQEKIWQTKYNKEAKRLSDLRKDAANRKWRDEQNAEMRKPLLKLATINQRLKDEDPANDDSWRNWSYDAEIRRAEKEKAKREQELLQRYKDELDSYQQKIDDAKAEKADAIAYKNKLLRRPAVEVDETEVEEIGEAVEIDRVTETYINVDTEEEFDEVKAILSKNDINYDGGKTPRDGILIHPGMNEKNKQKVKKAIHEIKHKLGKGVKVSVSESCGKKITEAPEYELSPRYDSRKSFYGKAKVDTGRDNNQNKLYSYGTLVAEIKDGKPVVYGTYSQTTLRHIKDWLKQNGFRADNSNQIWKDYGMKNESCKRESIGSDLGEFQKWVDYDMDKYGKVSNNTMSKIRKAGLTLVKDDYGDWEVIAKRPIKREEQSNPDDEI